MYMENFAESVNLDFKYDGEDEFVLKDINISFKQGEMTAVLGHNGCGKSTFAKHLNAILLPSGGTVGMVFQNPDNQIVATIVEEDVAFALENLGVEPNEIRRRVDEALKAVGMYEYRMHAPHQLSGGQKQRVAIAGIIAMRPRCIVLDEPTAMLDPKGRSEVMKTVKELNSKYGITIILITHYMEEAAQCERIIVMDKGKVLMDDSPKQVFSRVEELKAVGLDVPQVTELIYELNKYGLKLDTHIINENECCDALLTLLS